MNEIKILIKQDSFKNSLNNLSYTAALSRKLCLFDVARRVVFKDSRIFNIQLTNLSCLIRFSYFQDSHNLGFVIWDLQILEFKDSRIFKILIIWDLQILEFKDSRIFKILIIWDLWFERFSYFQDSHNLGFSRFSSIFSSILRKFY